MADKNMNASLRLSGLNIRKYYDKSITDELLTDKATGIMYYNTPDKTNPNSPIINTELDNTISIDLMNRSSSALNEIDNILNKIGGCDYKAINFMGNINGSYKEDDNGAPFCLGDKGTFKFTINNSEFTGYPKLMIYIDACFARKNAGSTIRQVDISQSSLELKYQLIDFNSNAVNEINTIYNNKIYNALFNSQEYTINITNDNSSIISNNEIFIYGIYLVGIK